MSIKQRREQATRIFTILRADNPQPTTELVYNNTFELLIAVVLSAQATDVGVNKATAKLFPIAATAAAIENLGIDGLIPYIKTIGLFRSKAKNIIALAHILTTQYNGEVPTTRAELEALPGVGRKTANVILNTAFKQPTIAVDTHVFRLANRLGIASGKNVAAVEDKLLKIIPQEFLLNAHHWLILHGRYICKSSLPLCTLCKIHSYCDYFKKLQ